MHRIYAIISILLILSACKPRPETTRFSGSAMGTSYNILIISDDTSAKDEAKQAIENAIKRVDQHLSNWNPNSDISKFNQSPVNTPFGSSAMLMNVMLAANIVHEQSNGFFDTTLAPVIQLWGFGVQTDNRPRAVPSQKSIAAALQSVGQSSQLRIDPTTGTITKLNPDLIVDLSAIAKGYGIDQIAHELAAIGIDNFMVEIGGDLITRGSNPYGQAWQIGIEQPDLAGKTIQRLVKISDMAMATSGDYRNLFEQDGVTYSHIINPKTGFPVKHGTVSVTVLAKNAMLADAWATALLAMGVDEGIKVAEQRDIAAFFIFHDAEHSKREFNTMTSSSFKEINQKRL